MGSVASPLAHSDTGFDIRNHGADITLQPVEAVEVDVLLQA